MDYAVIGAGLAGLTAAYELTKQGANCVILEKSRAVGGRMATRRHEGCSFDHGAQYITVKTPDFAAFLKELDLTDRLVPVARPVVDYPYASLDEALASAQARTRAGSATAGEFPDRYVFRDGMTGLCKALAGRLRPNSIDFETYVEAVRWDAGRGRWVLYTRGDNTTLGGELDAARLVLAMPAPQAAQLLDRSRPLSPELDSLADLLATATYHPCLTLVWSLGEDRHFEPVGAFRASRPDLPIGWLAWVERLQPSRVPAGESLLVAQLSPATSAHLFDAGDDEVIRTVTTLLANDLGITLPTVRWMQVKRWRYALPGTVLPADSPTIRAAENLGVHLCGDYLAGGRVEAAFLSGRATALRLG